jgi:hypothetical protein
VVDDNSTIVLRQEPFQARVFWRRYWAGIHSSVGTLCTRVGHWPRRPPGYLAVFSTFARLRPFTQYEAAERALSTYTRGVWELSRENLSVVRKAYMLGRHPLLDVIAEERRSIEVEMGYTDMLKHAYDAAVEIERAVGVWPH